jgi:xanthine/CO dehydrogenase XdhC/CoxF family maturation factor
MLRQTRDEKSSDKKANDTKATNENGADDWLVVSAADPLNLVGILTESGRIPATHKNAIVLQSGRVVATLVGGQFEFDASVDAAAQWEMRLSLVRGRRTRGQSNELSAVAERRRRAADHSIEPSSN